MGCFTVMCSVCGYIYTHAHIYMKFSSTWFHRAVLRLYQPHTLGVYGWEDGISGGKGWVIDLILGSPKPHEMCTCSVSSLIACDCVAFGDNLKILFQRLSCLLIWSHTALKSVNKFFQESGPQTYLVLKYQGSFSLGITSRRRRTVSGSSGCVSCKVAGMWVPSSCQDCWSSQAAEACMPVSTIQLRQHSDYNWDNGWSSDHGELPLQFWLSSLLALFCWQHQCQACDGWATKSPGCFPQLFSGLVSSVLSLSPALHPSPFHTGAFGEGAASSSHRAACYSCAPQQECGKQAVFLLAATALEG